MNLSPRMQLLTHQTFGARQAALSSSCTRSHRESVQRIVKLIHAKLDDVTRLLDVLEDEEQDLFIEALHRFEEVSNGR